MAIAFLFTIFILAIDAATGTSCDESVVEIVSTTTSDAYVDIQDNGNNKKNYGTKNGLFLQNEGTVNNLKLYAPPKNINNKLNRPNHSLIDQPEHARIRM